MHFKFRYKRIKIGLRTIKTATAVLISMLIINHYGLSTSKIIFAMLGAMAAMEHTFKESVEACLTQFVGVIFGALAGVILMALPLPYLLDAGIGIVVVITLYNVFSIKYSPTLPCLIVVTVCTTPDIMPLDYALGRLWATGIGLLVGMLINTLIFPYDNSNKIRATVEYLDKELIAFLEDMFDGDEHLPGTEEMVATIDEMALQLKIFSQQSLLLRKSNKKRQLATFQDCAGKERQLLARMEVLCRAEKPGRLNTENRAKLKALGADIKDERVLDRPTEMDIVTNYHVKQILKLRAELMDELRLLYEDDNKKLKKERINKQKLKKKESKRLKIKETKKKESVDRK